MRDRLTTVLGVVVLVAASVCTGCARSYEEPRSVANEPSSRPLEGEGEAEAERVSVDAPDVDPATRPRPRLSRTITLGAGADAPYIPPAPAATNTNTNTVVVNNNVVVQDASAGRYFGGYTYYAPRQGYGYGRPTTFYDGHPSGTSRGAVPQWGSGGWEGARRTAAPGQTPGIGGNWAPVPSYGPAQMK